jgi:hypothetical protein
MVRPTKSVRRSVQTDDPNKRGERGVKRLGSTEDDTGKRSVFSWSGRGERRCGRV